MKTPAKCYGKSELALLYFPDAMTTSGALSKSPIRDLMLQSWKDEQLYLQARDNLSQSGSNPSSSLVPTK
jgi:hypothetical protein